MSRHRRQTGFTLLEMLVALTLIVTILAMVYGSFAATTRSIDACGARMARIERACFVLRLMTRQIRCAYAPNTSSSSGPGPNGAANALAPKRSGPFQGDSRHPRGEILSFITSSGVGTGPDAPRGLLHVSYLYDRSSSTLSIRREDPAGPSNNRQRPGRSDSLLSGVTGVELTFHDGRQWQRVWDADHNHVLPRAVKVEITVSDEAGRPHVIGTTIPIGQQVHPESRSVRRTVAAGP